MSLQAKLLRKAFAEGDKKRDAGLTTPGDITRHDNISYGPHGQWNLLDVYYPGNAEGGLPTIVNVHGGGYVYGTKEVYQFYCMDLAQRGFCVVSHNYRLAPEHKYPAPLEDLTAVFNWILENATEYHIDTQNLFMVGDSAGGQITSQYATLLSNPEYAALFPFAAPQVTLRAVGLNCGMYNLADPTMLQEMKSLKTDYFGKDMGRWGKQAQVLDYITASYPPASITTAENDFLRNNAEPMGQLLTSRGVENEVGIYGAKEDKETGHVFHCNIRNPEGRRCNDDQCAFFKKHVV